MAQSSHSALCPFGFTCDLECIKTGSAKLSVSLQHLFHYDFGVGAKSLSYTVQFRVSYLCFAVQQAGAAQRSLVCLPVPI